MFPNQQRARRNEIVANYGRKNGGDFREGKKKREKERRKEEEEERGKKKKTVKAKETL